MSLRHFSNRQRGAHGVSLPAAHAGVLSQAAPTLKKLRLARWRERLVGGRDSVWTPNLVPNPRPTLLPNLRHSLSPAYFPL